MSYLVCPNSRVNKTVDLFSSISLTWPQCRPKTSNWGVWLWALKHIKASNRHPLDAGSSTPNLPVEEKQQKTLAKTKPPESSPGMPSRNLALPRQLGCAQRWQRGTTVDTTPIEGPTGSEDLKDGNPVVRKPTKRVCRFCGAVWGSKA